MKPRQIKSSLRMLVLVAFMTAAGLQYLAPVQISKANVSAGFSEYFIPGAAAQLFAILQSNSPSVGFGSSLHNVITIPITTPNLSIFYDHWENGYTTGATGDEVYSGYPVGSVLTFESPAIPANPRGTGLDACADSANPNGTTTACYDGRDRIFIFGGAVFLAQAFWPTGIGPIFANAWEVHPVKAWEASYTLPVGENLYNLPAYADFDNVYVLIQASQDNTIVSMTNPGGTALPTTVLDRGQVTELYHVNAGALVTASKPVQVQFIVGRQDSLFDSRSHTLVPTGSWDNEYYSPVPSYDTSFVNIYVYNPTTNPLVVTYQDLGGVYPCNIPPGGTLSSRACTGRFVAAGSAAHLSAASNFFAIGEYDTGSESRNWGFSIIPADRLDSDYYVAWAPGTSDAIPSANASPVFVTPTQDGQVIYVDYSPTDALVDAIYTINRLEVQKIRDPDNINTGMHVWSNSPFSITWGEDAQYSEIGNPYIDAGYTVLPLNPDWIDIALDLDQTANPVEILPQPGQTVEFTLDVSTGEFAIEDVYVTDVLPPYFEYVPGTTSITWPAGSSTTDPTISGNLATGQILRWGIDPENIADLLSNEVLEIKFKAITVAGFNVGSNVNNATATGAWSGLDVTATAQAMVTAHRYLYLPVIGH